MICRVFGDRVRSDLRLSLPLVRSKDKGSRCILSYGKHPSALKSLSGSPQLDDQGDGTQREARESDFEAHRAIKGLPETVIDRP